ncbi:MAG: hypothetical protein ABSF43_16990 [Rectinemataceae bacterium]|jgi:hypothetical protein
MALVFIDTAALYGIIFPRDQLNDLCKEILQYLIDTQCRLVTHKWIEYETISRLKKNGAEYCDAYTKIKQTLPMSVYEVSQKIEHEALQLFWNYRDKAWSVTDCVSFSMMAAMTLSYAFTSDHHFSEAGFFPLLEFVDGRPHRTFEHLL